MSKQAGLIGARIVAVAVIATLGLAGTPAAGYVSAGPAGDYLTIQEALDDALSTPTQNEVRIQAGVTYSENLVLSVTDGRLFEISGGWDASFTTRTNNPNLTIIDGGANGRVADVVVEGGSSFFIEYLTFQNGSVVGQGGGVRLTATSAGDVGLYNNIFKENFTLSGTDGPAKGGGLYLVLFTTGAEVNNNRFSDNSVRVALPAPWNQDVMGGGIYAELGLGSSLQLDNNVVDSCYCWAYDLADGDDAKGCGAYILAPWASTLDFSRNAVIDSRVHGFSKVQGIAGYAQLGSEVTMERNRWQGASLIATTVSNATLLHLVISSSAELTQRSSLIADSPVTGLRVTLSSGSSGFWQGVNLTIAGHEISGLNLLPSGDATPRLYNSIVSENTEDLINGGFLEQGSNLIGTDPSFLDSDSGSYQLQAGSPALEAGDNNPPGGLSTLDLDGEARVQGTFVDIGAYEGTGSMIWADGFESGETNEWSDSVP